LYHGGFSASHDDVEGERACAGTEGIYVFDSQIKDLHKFRWKYVYYTPMNWSGVLFGVLWEVAYHNPSAVKQGSAKNQTVCHPDRCVPYNLIIRVVDVADCEYNNEWVLMPMSGKMWDPLLEANPLDPTRAQNRRDGQSQNCVLAAILKNRMVRDSDSSAKTAAVGVKVDMDVASDSHALATLMNTLTLDDTMHPMSAVSTILRNGLSMVMSCLSVS